MKGNRLLIIPALVLGLTLSVLPASAAPPDAGQMLNQQRQPDARLPDRLPRDDKKGVERPPMKDTGVKVQVKGFRFSGHLGLATDAELEALVGDGIGKELGFAQLQSLVERVTAYLREQKEYLLARAYLPGREITEGIVEIAVIAGRIDGKVRVTVKDPRRISLNLLEKIAEKAIPEGEAIRMGDLERAVLLMNDLPAISSHASLEPGGSPGSTSVGIDVVEGPMMGGVISGDNYGDRYTGTWRGIGQVAASDPFGLGDQLSLSVTCADRMAQGNVAYSLPFRATGVTWSVFYTGLYYELGKDMSSLDAEGSADTIATTLTYPLLRSRKASIWTGLGFEHLVLEDEVGNTTISKRKLPVGKMNFFGNFFDTWGGGGLSSASLALYYGRLDLNDIAAARTADALGPQSAGNFVRATYSLARLQRLSRTVSFFGSIRGQLADGNLGSSQKFILGGPTGVRAYPVGEASGDEGHSMTCEIRVDLPDSSVWDTVQLVGFIDTGWTKLHKDQWTGSVTNVTGRNNYWLSGGGCGISIGREGVYSIRASYAHKIDNNPGRNAAGDDADNRSDDGRFWVQAVVWF